MTRRTFAARLAALEAHETRQAAEEGPAAHAARQQRRRERLAALGFTSDDARTLCECCKWAMPRVVLRRALDDTTVDHCPICGGAVFGPVAARRHDYFPEARYGCPRCRHTYTGARHTLTPCPACGYAPPPYPDGDDDEAAQRYVGAVAAGLARLYGAPVALAWLDVPDDAAGRADLAALDRWWYEEVPHELLDSAREWLAGDDYHVAHSLRDGALAWFTLSPSPYGATWAPAEEADARWVGRLLEGLARAQGAPLPATRDDARALLATLTICETPAVVAGATPD